MFELATSDIAYRDLFALGCYLHKTGVTSAGISAVRTAMRSAGIHGDIRQRVLDTLEGNEDVFAKATNPHNEILELFPR